MKLLKLEIYNFRGIKEAKINFDEKTNFSCFIGPGDSGKTTILTAIQWLFNPSWNLMVSDTDFYRCQIENPIRIVGTIADFPTDMYSEEKFGFYLQRPPSEITDLNDEPISHKALCLTISLTIDRDLEPKWEVETARREPKVISANERRKLNVNLIGYNCDRDLTWGNIQFFANYWKVHKLISNQHKQNYLGMLVHLLNLKS